MASAVDATDKDAIRHGVAPLDSLPGALLALAVLRLLCRKPTDRRWVEEDFGTRHRRESRGFGIPLIPANEHPDLADRSLPGPEAEVSRGEIELLVELRVVRDVHLPVLAEVPSVGIDHGSGVVVETLGTFLEQRGDDDDTKFLRDLPETVGAGTRDRLREPKEFVILALAEVVPAEELLEANHLGAPGYRLPDSRDGPIKVAGGVATGCLLDQPDPDSARSSHKGTKIMARPRSRREVIIRRAPIAACAIVLAMLLSAPLGAQRIDWRTRAVFYGDDTEFFTSYRVGETILGGQLSSWIEAETGRRTELRVGVFADRRWGSEEFTDSVKPILSFRYGTKHSRAVLGTLETVRRHGLLEPIMVTTRELTTPIEYGLQYLETRGVFRGEAWINWMKLNTPTQREQFEVGLTVQADVTAWLALHGQHLWLHRGGQLYQANVTTSNNRVTALGVTLHRKVDHLGETSLAAWRLFSAGHIDPNYPVDRPRSGQGTWLRAGVTPMRRTELFALRWTGRDFSGEAGDNNYNSAGHNSAFYRSRRAYTELGVLHRTPVEGGVTLDVEARWHRIDHEQSIAFFGTPWELSYRVVVRAPIDVRLRRR